MRIFLATVEERSFTRAAMKQNISQPAATIIINQIEEETQAELFVRNGNARKAELTSRGRLVAETFSRIISGYDTELLRINDAGADRRSEKRILIQPCFATALKESWLMSLIDTIDGERLILEELPREGIVEKVYAREANLGLIDGDVDQERSDFAQLADYRFVLAVPEGRQPPPMTNGYVAPQDLPEDTLVLTGVSKSTLRALRKNLIAGGADLSLTHDVSSLNLLVRLMRHSSAYALIPSVLYGTIHSSVPCRIFEVGNTPVKSVFGLLSPWGYMNRVNMNAIRNTKIFSEADIETDD